jgi:hypothetical protein
VSCFGLLILGSELWILVWLQELKLAFSTFSRTF